LPQNRSRKTEIILIKPRHNPGGLVKMCRTLRKKWRSLPKEAGLPEQIHLRRRGELLEFVAVLLAIGDSFCIKRLDHLFHFRPANCTRDVMSDSVAHGESRGCIKILQQWINHRPRDTGKGVSVVETEWREPMTFPASVERFDQTDFAGAGIFPKSESRFVTVAGGFVEGGFGPANGRVVVNYR
jgi:hypothetical protein